MPLNGHCVQQDVIYHAEVLEGEPKKYIGSTTDFKKRYHGHTASFRNQNKRSSTTLSNHVWDAILGPEPKIKWSILAHATSYTKGSRVCDLCLTKNSTFLKISATLSTSTDAPNSPKSADTNIVSCSLPPRGNRGGFCTYRGKRGEDRDQQSPTLDSHPERSSTCFPDGGNSQPIRRQSSIKELTNQETELNTSVTELNSVNKIEI